MLHLRDHVTPPKSHIRSRVSLVSTLSLIVVEESERLYSLETLSERGERGSTLYLAIINKYLCQLYLTKMCAVNERCAESRPSLDPHVSC